MENILVTGSAGVVAENIIPFLSAVEKYQVYGLDINEPSVPLKPLIKGFTKGSILQKPKIIESLTKNKISSVFHFAEVLPMDSEITPEKTQVINSGGTATLLEAVKEVSQKEKRIIKIIFPSTIAVYGLPSIEEKVREGKLVEDKFLNPITMYGITKLYCEKLGIYYFNKFPKLLDFRSLRIPGILGAIVPSSKGERTPSLIHAAAEGSGFETYVKPETKLPFIALPDLVRALIQLNEVERKGLTIDVYNVSSFSLTTEELAQNINSIFPDSSISYSQDKEKQKIVDTWPAELDIIKAQNDWKFAPIYDVKKTFKEYLPSEVQSK